jgi:heme exporter protein D
MNWSSASEFWAMGGYGLYVWGSFGVTTVLMAFEVWQAARQRDNLLKSLRIQAVARDSEQDWD